MSRTFNKTCGVSIAALALGLSFVASPVLARGGFGGGGVGALHGGGGGWHGGGGAWHGGGGWNGGYGGYGGWGGGYGQDYGYGGVALGAGLLGAAILGSQVPYYGSGYAYPQGGGGESSASCESRFKSYNPATGTYLGYDGLRHPCP